MTAPDKPREDDYMGPGCADEITDEVQGKPTPGLIGLVEVAGRTCQRSIRDMERAAKVLLTSEQGVLLPNNALVALLCDYIRMGREYADSRKDSVTGQGSLEQPWSGPKRINGLSETPGQGQEERDFNFKDALDSALFELLDKCRENCNHGCHTVDDDTAWDECHDHKFMTDEIDKLRKTNWPEVQAHYSKMADELASADKAQGGRE